MLLKPNLPQTQRSRAAHNNSQHLRLETLLNTLLHSCTHTPLKRRDVGAMDTHHHMVSVRVKSVLDSVDDEEYEGPADDAMKELQASQQMVRGGAGVLAFGGVLRGVLAVCERGGAV